MIEITRALARQLRTVLRKAVPLGAGRSYRPALVLHASPDGLRVRAHHLEVAVEYHLPGARPADTIALPVEALGDLEGRHEDTVTLEAAAAGSVRAHWDDGGVPQAREYAATDPNKLPPFPEGPRKFMAIEAGFLRALEDAAQTAGRDPTRYAVQKVQLRGGTGDVVTTDGRQLLIQGGYALPWKDNVLVPAVGAFGCRELPADGEVALGKTDSHVAIRVGSWTFWLAIDTEGRFPQTDQVIPSQRGPSTTCRLAPEDATFLGQTLPRLPGGRDDNAPLTVDLNGTVAVRARTEGQQPAEVVLARSTVDGPPVRVVCNRQFLARALRLGFTEFRIMKATQPVVGHDSRRTYVWMPLDPTTAIPPGPDVYRLTSDLGASSGPSPQPERRTEPMPVTPTNGNPDNGHPNGTEPEHWGIAEVIAETEALRGVLQDAATRTARLLAALKHQRRRSRAVQQAMQSLKQLQLDH